MRTRDYSFDYYVRSLTTSLIALGILAVNLYLYIRDGQANGELIGWSGLIVGAYIGNHSALNGRAQGRRIEREVLAAEVAGLQTVKTAAGVKDK